MRHEPVEHSPLFSFFSLEKEVLTGEQSDTSTDYSEDIEEGHSEESAESHADVALEYVQAVLTGMLASVKSTVNDILHPWDNLLEPLTNMVYDVALTAVASNNEDSSKNPSLYEYTVARGRACLERFTNLKDEFLGARGPKKVEMITQFSTNILLPLPTGMSQMGLIKDILRFTIKEEDKASPHYVRFQFFSLFDKQEPHKTEDAGIELVLIHAH